MNTDEDFKEITGFTYQEYALLMSTSRRLLIDKVVEMKEGGRLSEDAYNEIIGSNTEWFIENYSHLLPSTL